MVASSADRMNNNSNGENNIIKSVVVADELPTAMGQKMQNSNSYNYMGFIKGTTDIAKF
jgi:hypothetical protein